VNEHDRNTLKSKRLGSAISFAVSIVLHLAITLALSWIVIGYSGTGTNGIQLNGTQVSEDADSDLPTLEIAETPSLQPTMESVQLPSEVTEAITRAKTPIQVSASTALTAPNLSSSAFEETTLALMMGGEGEEGEAAGGGSPGGNPSGAGATFFGTRATGHRFVFVIDSSSSMIGPRWQSLRRELIRAIRSLSPDQEFFVISFDFAAHPMFNELPPKGKFLNPTKENVEKLNRWIGSIQHGSNTLPASAIGIALRLEPDAIFLLSDGEIRDATLFDLRTYNRTEDDQGKISVRIPIHTVLLQSDVGFLTLKTIADENDGVFTPVPTFSN
jgi:hypothetical protein